MRIPEAKENQVNIMPRVGGAELPAPVITNNGAAEVGNQLQQSLNNASQGFIKMYVADQRADAIHAYADYNKRLKELLNSGFEVDPVTGMPTQEKSKIDPKTGLPVGFKQLRGDQINEENLKKWQDDANAAKIEFENKIKGFIPDIQDEFKLKAEQDASDFDLQVNSHFLQGKYEKAKNAANENATNTITNTTVGINEEYKIKQAYDSLYNDYYTAYQSDDVAKKMAKDGIEKLIHNNVVRIIRTGTDTSYDDARNYVKNPSIKKNLSEVAFDKEIHDLDLESAQWMMSLPNTDTPTIQNYIKKHTDHLTLKEKALFVSEAQKRDYQKAGTGDEKKVSDWFFLINRLASAQRDYLSSENPLGIYINKDIDPAEVAQFHANILEFGKSLNGIIYNSPYNMAVVREQGLDALLPEAQVKKYKNGKFGQLMQVAYNEINRKLKSGELSLLNITQMSALGTNIDAISKENFEMGQLRDRRIQLENKLTELSNILNENPTSADINNTITYLKEYQRQYGSLVTGFDDKKFFELNKKVSNIIGDNIIAAYERDRGPIEKIRGSFSQLKQWGQTWFDRLGRPGNILTKQEISKNNELLLRWNRIGNSNVKNENGGRSIYVEGIKYLLSAQKAMMNGNGLTVANLRPDGSPDPMSMEENLIFAVDMYKSDGITPADSETILRNTIDEFLTKMEAKYNNPNYRDFNSVDYDSFTVEERRLFQEMLSRNWLEGNGIKNKTMLPEYSLAVSPELDNMLSPQYYPNFGGMISYPDNRENFELENKRLYIGDVNYTDARLRSNSFLGGITSNSDAASLVEAGFVNAEDELLQQKISSPKAMGLFSRSEIMHNLLNILAPNGTRTKFVDPVSGNVSYYFDIDNTIQSAAYQDKYMSGLTEQTKLQKEVFLESQELLENILVDLQKDNPESSKDVFLTPGVLDYNVSDDTLQHIETYQKLRKKMLQVQRDNYMILGRLGPESASDWAKYQKQLAGEK